MSGQRTMNPRMLATIQAAGLAGSLAISNAHEARRLLGMQPVAPPIIPVVGTLAS